MISAPKFIDGGAPILAQAPKKIKIERAGVMDIRPLVRANLRVFVLSYIELARANRADEARPWAIIMVREPINLHWENIKSLQSISPIWLTDAYAIRDFISGWRAQIIAVYAAPKALILITKNKIKDVRDGQRKWTRIRP